MLLLKLYMHTVEMALIIASIEGKHVYKGRAVHVPTVGTILFVYKNHLYKMTSFI